jgi:hypothetical protein
LKRFVVAATARSGTTFTSLVLRASGVRCGHEQVFRVRPPGFHGWGDFDGDCSWMSVPFLEELPEGTLVFHQVRHPLAAIRSLASTGQLMPFSPGRHVVMPIIRAFRGKYPGDRYRSFLRRHDRASFAEPTELARAGRHWLRWNRAIERAAHRAGHTYRRFHLESLDLALLNELLVAIGAPPRQSYPTVPTDANKRPSRYPHLDWADLPSELRDEVLERAESYGYDSAGGATATRAGADPSPTSEPSPT